MRNNLKKIMPFFIMLIVYAITIGYSAFSSELSISKIVAEVRIKTDTRVTNMMYNSSANGGLSLSENYDVTRVMSWINLPNSNSTVTYQIGITNFGNTEMGVYSIDGLPNNLTYELSDYKLGEKMCDNNGQCSLGSTKNFYLTIKYKEEEYNSSQTEFDIKLNLEFRKMHVVTYVGITNNNYPTSVIDGGNLTFQATESIPPKIVAFNSLGDRYDYSLYSYLNNKFTFNNVTSDITLKYQEKAYLKALTTDTDFKESTYKKVIDSIKFVNYVDTNNAVKTYDLSDVSGSKDIIGWITSDNDLYIGSEWDIYGKSFEKYFYGMTGVQTIKFDNLNTSEATTMYYMFTNCKELIDLDVSNFNTSNVKSMGRMFESVSKLSTLDVSGFDTSNVTSMHGMFSHMTSLNNLDVSQFKTGNVVGFNEMFLKVSAPVIDVSNFDTSSAQRMAYMFGDLSNVTELDLSNFNTEKVTDMSYMFYNCAKIEELDLTSFKTPKLTKTNNMFMNCTNLTSIKVDNFNTAVVKDMSYMFYNCQMLKTLDISHFNTVSCTNMSNMFAHCRALQNLNLNAATFTHNPTSTDMFANVYKSINIIAKDVNAQTFIENALGEGVGTVTIATA